MNAKTLIAAMLGGISSFLLGGFLYGFLFRSTLEGLAGSATNVWRPNDEIILWALLLGNLIIGYLVAFIFTNWAGSSTFTGGLKAGAIIGGLYALGFDLLSYGTSQVFQLGGALLDVGLSIVIWALSSGVVGWWLGLRAAKS